MQAALPKPNRFRRGPLANKGPEVPRWPPTPSSTGIEGNSHRGKSAASVHNHRPPPSPLQCAMQAIGPDNVVVQMPGTARADRPTSYRSSIMELDTDLERNLDTAPNPHGGIHPSVVARSVFKDPLALDAAFNGFNSRRKRPW